jgi:2-C-methyl-D-erythritol 4-phosphate cytidylyltransferase/2-C-methyl-D-erythritol 2,4-cyclodiphosphate synthase
VFPRAALTHAYRRAEDEGFSPTDEASAMERVFGPVFLVEHPDGVKNKKLTGPEDFALAEKTIGGPVQTGFGYDVHRLVEGRKLILCGVDIPHAQGLLGHSDADVAVHALMDALLGAAALGDIGRHFPDDDPAYLGISSMALLETVVDRLWARGYFVWNADVTIVAQRPKLAPFMADMVAQLAKGLRVPVARVNVKATTTERLGFEGRGEGISAMAVAGIRAN